MNVLGKYYTQNDKVENMCFKIESGVKTACVEGYSLDSW